MELTTISNNQITMSSLEIVDLINQERKAEAERSPGQKWLELRHDNFMAKVPKVLGENNAPKFLGTQKYGNNNTRPIYNLPQREAFLMVMSESYELQAKLYDAYETLKNKSKSFVSLQEGIQNQITQMQVQIIELQKQFLQLNSNVTALINNLAIKNEPKPELEDNKIGAHMYYRIVNYGRKFRTDLNEQLIKERAMEIGQIAKRMSREKKYQVIEEDSLDSRYPNKTRYYHQDILKEVFRLIF
jgi:hypothetical protein